MCYDIKVSLESQLRRAQLSSNLNSIKELEEKIRPFIEPNLYHTNGYTHPQTLIYTNNEPFLPTVSVWGLIPHWVKDNEKRLLIWNKTLNARVETIFDKPSFKESAQHKRCIIILDGFYEHHYYKGKAYPFFIQKKSKRPFSVAGLWSEWLDTESGEIINSFTIITTRAKKLMAKIHNNPKLIEPRMPMILPEEKIEDWLAPVKTTPNKRWLEEFLASKMEDELSAHSVQKLRGNNALGNVPEASTKFVYAGLPDI